MPIVELLDAWVIPLVWALWLLYWIYRARGVKPAARVDGWASFLAYRLPLVAGYLLIFGFSLQAGAHGWPWLFGRWLPAAPAWSWLGVALLLAGLGFACWARVVLGRNWSATVQLKQDHELVTSGPYQWVRHPIYTGMLLGLLGTAIAYGQWRALLALVIVAGAFGYKLRHEEAWMREQFGAAYVDYMRRSKALIPGVW